MLSVFDISLIAFTRMYSDVVLKDNAMHDKDLGLLCQYAQSMIND